MSGVGSAAGHVPVAHAAQQAGLGVPAVQRAAVGAHQRDGAAEDLLEDGVARAGLRGQRRRGIVEGEQPPGLFLVAALALPRAAVAARRSASCCSRPAASVSSARASSPRSPSLRPRSARAVRSPAARRCVARASVRTLRSTSTSTPIQAMAMLRPAASASSSASVGESAVLCDRDDGRQDQRGSDDQGGGQGNSRPHTVDEAVDHSEHDLSPAGCGRRTSQKRSRLGNGRSRPEVTRHPAVMTCSSREAAPGRVPRSVPGCTRPVLPACRRCARGIPAAGARRPGRTGCARR